MQVISLCALRASGFEWQPRAGTYAFTAICKATFELRPGQLVLAEAQEPVNDEDGHWDDDPSRSVRTPSDRVPYKPAVDVVLVGSAFAPRQQPARNFTVRLSVAEIDKVIEVWCDRKVRQHDGQVIEGPRITKMPLRWERAAGGPDTQNPSGMPFDAAPDRYGNIPIANLQPAGAHFAAPGDSFAPVGYGPIAPSWSGRILRLHRHAATFTPRGWEGTPLPEDFDYGYFNMAPRDQQIAQLLPGQRILLESLHPAHAVFAAALPPIQPRAMTERATGEREEIALVADTLWLDTDRGLCTVVWRGRIGLRHPREAGRILVTIEGGPGKSEEENVHTIAPGLIAGNALPFPVREAGPRAAPAARDRGASDALPFGRDGAALGALASPLRAEPPAPKPVALSIGQRVAGGAGVDALKHSQEKPASPVAASTPLLVADGPSLVRDAAIGGVAAASNAAARQAERPNAGRLFSGRAAVELVWVNPGSMARIRKQALWKELLSGLKPRPEDEDLDDDLPPARRIPARDRRETMTILSRGEPLDVTAVEDALRRAMEDEDGFTPPLVLATGELEMRFDELEALKALLAALSPHVPGDRRLEEAVAKVQEALKMPWTQSGGGALEELADQLRKLFGEAHKGVQADVVDGHAERSLLDGRHYRKRTVFGQPRLVGMLASPGMKPVLPVYLPDALAKDLPAMRRFPVRLIAEVRPRAEQNEASPAALRAVALGRIVGAGW